MLEAGNFAHVPVTAEKKDTAFLGSCDQVEETLAGVRVVGPFFMSVLGRENLAARADQVNLSRATLEDLGEPNPLGLAEDIAATFGAPRKLLPSSKITRTSLPAGPNVRVA